MMKCLLSLSGGLDSTVLLAKLLDSGYEVETVAFMYGSKHNALERKCAADLAAHYKTFHTTIFLASVFEMMESALLNKDTPVPEGHYEAESMRATVVPGRNMIFASILGGLAMSRGIPEVVMGVHAGDHFIYPDCRPDFIVNMRNAIFCATDKKVGLTTPFLHHKKAEIVAIGLKLQVPFHLTRTCYGSNEKACGKCGACVERKESFELNGAKDHLEYQ